MELLPIFALGAILVETGLGRARGALHCFVKGLMALAVGTVIGFVGQDQSNALLCGTVALLATLGLGDRTTLSAATVIAATTSLVHKSLLILDRLVGVSTTEVFPGPLSAFKPVLNWLSSYWQPDQAFVWSVHTLAGGAALGALIAAGPRIGRYSRNGLPMAIPAHNLPLAVIGVFLIWLGLQGFSKSLWESATLCGFAALSTSFVWTKWRFGKVDPSFAITAFWAGLVGGLSIKGVAFSLALLVGIFSGAISIWVSLLLDKNFVDDPVGIVPAEGTAPLIGLTILWLSGSAPLGEGLVNWVLAFTAGLASTWLVCRVLTFFNLLRIHPMDELEGADLRLYGIAAYPEFEMREA